MLDIKTHLINIAAVGFFSFSLATTTNQVIRQVMTPAPVAIEPKAQQNSMDERKIGPNYQAVIDSGFFVLARPEVKVENTPQMQQITDMVLLGTITGPPSLARAIIKKRSDQSGEIFPLYGNVYGYKLVSVEEKKVKLSANGTTSVLDLYPEESQKRLKKNPSDDEESSDESSNEPVNLNQKLSRAELQQNMKNNMDNLLMGIRAGPYREDDKITGFKLIRVAPENMLYKFGMRSGDIIRRINGHPVESTAQLYQMWQQFPKESRIQIDVDRDGKVLTFNYTISD